MGESDEGRTRENDCNGIVENSKDSKSWKTISSVSDIQKQSRNWTLAGDAGLLEYLQGFSHQLISKTHEIEKNVDQLIHETKVTSSRVNNIINDFLMLSNTQFIENRVYDEEVQTDSSATSNKQEEQKTKEQREAEIIPQISTALALGLEVIDKAFDQVEIQGDSDSEDEEGRTVHGESLLEPKDPYLHRSLPHIIGTDSFYNDDTVGLFDLVSNDIESESESDQKEYDSGGDSTDESFEEPAKIEKESEAMRRETLPDGVPNFAVGRKMSSDSDSSDMFGDEAEYISGSADSDEIINAEKQNDMEKISANKPESEEDVSEDLFSDVFSVKKGEEKPSFLQNSPSKNSLFDDEDDFEETSSKTKERLNTGQSTETIPENVHVPEKKEKKVNDLKGKQVMIAKDLDALFQSGDDDLFAPKKVLEKAKAKDVKAERTKSVSLFDDDDDDEDDDGEKLFAECTTKPSIKSETPSNILAEEDEFEDTPVVTKPTSPSVVKSPFDSKSADLEVENLFMDDSQDDLFDVLDEIKKVPSPETPVKPPDATKTEQKITEDITITKRKPSMFSLLDEDEDDLFSLPKKETKAKDTLSNEVKTRSGSSLFEDDDLFKKDTDSPDVDLFATKPKSNVAAKAEALKTQGKLFDTTSDQNKQPKAPVGGVLLFGSADIFGRGKTTPEKTDDDMFGKGKTAPERKDDDMFGKGKTTPERTDDDMFGKGKTTPERTDDIFGKSKTTSVNSDILEDVSKPVPVPKTEDTPTVKNTEQISVSFDHPVDTSNTLNCAAKGRAKIQTRRRPPSRKGRQTALMPATEKPAEVLDHVDNIFDNTQKPETVPISVQSKETSIDILTSPSTEEDDIFPMSDPATRDIFSSIESKKDVSFTDGLFSNIEHKKSSSITDDIFDDDIFSAPVTKSIRPPVLSVSPDDIFSEEPTEKESSIFSSSSSKQYRSKQTDIFSESEEDIFSSQLAIKPTSTVTKKQPSIKQVKREADIFDDPLLGFSNSNND